MSRRADSGAALARLLTMVADGCAAVTSMARRMSMPGLLATVLAACVLPPTTLRPASATSAAAVPAAIQEDPANQASLQPNPAERQPPLQVSPATALLPGQPALAAAVTERRAPAPPAGDALPGPLPLPASAATVSSPDSGRDADTAKATLELLAFHERVREMSAADLARELARLGDAPVGPRSALSLAVVLAQTHGPGDLLRALALVEPIARSNHPAVLPWQPFARWLAARYGEQRRLEEQVERLTQQLREQQRRLDQLNEKLVALRGIERSLGRTGGAGSSRAGGTGR